VGSSSTSRLAPSSQPIERSGDGHGGLLRRRQHAATGCFDVDVGEPEVGECGLGPAPVGLPVDAATAPGGVADPHADVLDGVEPRDESEVLVYETDAGRSGRGPIAEAERPLGARGRTTV
jgi:hypothetical protein